MGCGATKATAEGGVPAIPAAGGMPKMPDPNQIMVDQLLDKLTKAPQWQKLAEGGFERSDADDSGKVDAKELSKTMEQIQTGVVKDLFPQLPEAGDVDQEAVKNAMAKYNKDDDSKLDKGEFVAFATEYIKVTISKNFKTLIEKKEDVKPSLEKLTKRVTQLVES
uniref:EF-hand domain-containing protein n=1 Tax=Chromera velia CCMP2878 TaxID=1169474 RepID=A0A0G4I522_9ALVE|eukprot:Cvel_11068.t1-p1 / transcript=Cvel_11068.t1 / gene=Cvel_11068 / organism=Chromera_velia_CCMP2878 / gene_product=hypothetical protein / transcript_product=hypothetical protein / location=Cvel_scaffold683:32144-32635(+) / protein_length=164 / sequence_SO=supercontig / SO=protein_coding / is_pseudo=false